MLKIDNLSLLLSGHTVFNSLDMFPQVSLNFAGGASLVLGPQDYLIKQNYIVSIQTSVSCITGFFYQIK